MRIVGEVERAPVAAHPSVLHRKHSELVAIVRESADAGACTEGQWFQVHTAACEQGS